MKLELIAEIANDIFSKVTYGFDYNMSGMKGYLLLWEPEVTITNTETNREHVAKDLLYKLEWKMEEDEDDPNDVVVNRLQRIRGGRLTMSGAEILARYAHPHFEGAGEWMYICLGSTELNEVISAMKHAERIDEDSMYFVLYMLRQLLSTESMEGGPYRYMSDLDDFQHRIDRMIEDNGQGAMTRDQAQSFWDRNSSGNIASSDFNRVRGAYFSEFLENSSYGNREAIAHLVEKFIEYNVVRTDESNREGRFVLNNDDLYQYDIAIEFCRDDLNDLLRPVIEEYYDFYYDRTGDSYTMNSHIFFAYEFPYGYDHYVHEAVLRTDMLGHPIPKYEAFKNFKIQFDDQIIHSIATDEDVIEELTTDYNFQTFTYYESTYPTIEQIVQKANEIEEHVHTEEVQRYAESIIASARRGNREVSVLEGTE